MRGAACLEKEDYAFGARWKMRNPIFRLRARRTYERVKCRGTETVSQTGEQLPAGGELIAISTFGVQGRFNLS